VWDTEANNGVLIYVLLAEHAIEIVADRGLNRVVGEAEWKRILESMRSTFRDRRYEEGLTQAIDAVDALLASQFPLDAGAPNPNELADRPWLR
jgi:uncharacterized membrane protein